MSMPPKAITEAAADLRRVIDSAQVVIGLKDDLHAAAKRLEEAAIDNASPDLWEGPGAYVA